MSRMRRLGGCISESSMLAIDMTDMNNTINMADLAEMQLESHDGVNYKVVDLGMIFEAIPS